MLSSILIGWVQLIICLISKQRRMKHRQLEQQFQRLDQIELNIYRGVQRRQANLLRDLQGQQQLRSKQAARRSDIRLKSNPETIKHPANNHVWVHLANFINHDQDIDLGDIADRKRERERRRTELDERKKEAQELQRPAQTIVEQSQGRPGKKEKGSWKLMRELRRKEVEENKRRLQRMEENKRQQMSYQHQY